MSIRFAGSSSVHERRRRRLAQESDVAGTADAQTAVHSQRTAASPRLSDVADEFTPLHSVIRPQMWIHWCVVAFCLACWGGMLYVGDLVEQTDVGLKSILGIRSGRLANFFSTIMLLWAGQLALLIYWYRRKSRNDFHGRYRLWIWVGVTLQFFLAVVATEAHRPFGDYMQRMWPVNVLQYPLLSWLVPVSTIGLAIFKLLRLEMRNCACSRTLLLIAGLSGVTAAVSLVVGSALPQRVCDLVQVGSATLAHVGLATALLFHARHVIHVTNEAPTVPREASLVGRIVRGVLRALRLEGARVRIPRWKLPRRKGRTNAAPPAKAAKQSPVSTRRPSPASPSTPAPQSKASAGTGDADRSTAEQKPRPASAAAPDLKRRIDAPEALKGPKRSQVSAAAELASPAERGDLLDDDAADGLSRKERRRLRKMQQAAGQHAHQG